MNKTYTIDASDPTNILITLPITQAVFSGSESDFTNHIAQLNNNIDNAKTVLADTQKAIDQLEKELADATLLAKEIAGAINNKGSITVDIP